MESQFPPPTGRPEAPRPPAGPAATPRPAPPQAQLAPAAAPPSGPLGDEPLLGNAFTALQGGARRDLVLGQLSDRLRNAPTERLAQAYQTARAELKTLMYDPRSDEQAVAAANDVMTAAMGSLRQKGIDPLNLPPPNAVRFNVPPADR